MPDEHEDTISLIEATNALVQIAHPLREFYLQLIRVGFTDKEALLMTNTYLSSLGRGT